MHKVYTIHPSSVAWILHDLDADQERSLRRHISAQDYFGTLATVISLISQTGDVPKESLAQEMVDELTFLQDNYTIKPIQK